MNLSDIQTLYNDGNTELIATMSNGEKQILRLFVSTSGVLAYFAKGKKTKGFALRNIVEDIVSVNIKNKKHDQSIFEGYLSNLKKFKKAYTQDIHPNLWGDLQDSYNRFDVDDFSNFATEKGLDNCTSSYDLYECLCEYCRIHNLNLNTENHWKTTTIKSNAPKYPDYQYNMCLENIKKHIDNKEDFRYYWEGNYDVSVSGKNDDGIYRAWFSLEYRGCGNGHYYLLINENQAVFAEDD